MVFRNNKGKVIGEFREGIYRKLVDSKKHKMKIYNAYGIDTYVIDEIKDTCTEVRLKEKDTSNVYSTTIENFLNYGIKANFDGGQIFLPMKYWVLETNKIPTLFA